MNKETPEEPIKNIDKEETTKAPTKGTEEEPTKALAKGTEEEPTKALTKNIEEKSTKPGSKKKILIGIVGIAVFLAGLTFLLVKIFLRPGKPDAEFLVEMGEWQREDAEGVIWNFTEIGKGTLTTNNHENDYEFLWAINGDTLKIETKWLYDLNDEYTYKLQQDNKMLILSSKTSQGDESANINFRATGRVNAEVPEDN